MNVEPVATSDRLRICVVGDIDGIHTQSWLGYFIARGHDLHAISYYTPARPPEGVRVRALRPAAAGGERAAGARPGLASKLPVSLQRLAHYLRYRRAGIAAAIRDIAPDIVHAHYVTEHGFYATSANAKPHVVSAWGSDILVDAAGLGINQAIARFVLRRATLATANNRYMAGRMEELGAKHVEHIVLGVPQAYITSAQQDRAQRGDATPRVISSRSLDSPLYNVDAIIRAMPAVRKRVPDAELVVAGEGRLRPRLESLAASLNLANSIRFVGQLSQDELRHAFAGAGIFVSMPSSDATSVALLQAIAAGCLPVVSDLPSQRELVENGVTGLRVPVRDEGALAGAIVRGLEDSALRERAAERNVDFVRQYGVLEDNMARMERAYYRLAGRAGN